MPNMYARGILFGKMVIELGDTCTAKCEKSEITADLEFKTKVRHLFAWIFSLALRHPFTFAHFDGQSGLTFSCT